MKTIALKDKTFKLIRELKEKEKRTSFDQLIMDLILKKECVPGSMFGALKGKTRGFTRKDREEIMGEDHRWK